VHEISLLAEDYLTEHRAELVAEAIEVINTSPDFVRWRNPPVQRALPPHTTHAQKGSHKRLRADRDPLVA
jgi:hypothetical protein